MFEVNLYIESTYKGLKSRDARWGYVLECKTSKGPVTRAECGRAEANFQRLALLAINGAMERLSKPCEIHIFSDCPFLVSAFEQDWLKKWSGNGWKNSREREIRNKDLWIRLLDHVKEHEVNVVFSEKHEFSVLLLAEMEMAAVGVDEKVTLNVLETA